MTGNTITNSGTIFHGNYGLNLSGNYTIINQPGGLIAGLAKGITSTGALTVYNQGVIEGSANSGYAITDKSAPVTITNSGVIAGGSGPGLSAINISLGGAFTNLAGGLVTATYGFINLGAGNINLYNAGTISGQSSLGGRPMGVFITESGSSYGVNITNATGGQISGSYLAMEIFNAGTTSLTNAGTIFGTGSGGSGVAIIYGSLALTNASTGYIGAMGSSNVALYGYGNSFVSVLNQGHIGGTDTSIGVELVKDTGSLGITNAAGATIAGIDMGISLQSNATVTIITAGSILGGTDAILAATGALDLVVESGAVFSGAVMADASAANIIELASGASAGTLDMGGSFSNFTNISFAAGAAWTLEGTTSELANGETISGFAAGDAIVLEGFSITSESFTTAGLVLDGSTTLDVSPVRLSISNYGGNATIAAEPIISTITGTITNTVTIDNVNYATSLTIAAGGAIDEVNPIGRAIWANEVSSFNLVNDGTIVGFLGSNVAGTQVNNGLITAGSTVSGQVRAVSMAAGTFVNTGTIIATSESEPWAVFLEDTAAGSNSGTIINNGAGWALQLLNTASFDNTGLIIAGPLVPGGSGDQITGAYVANSASLENSGTILSNSSNAYGERNYGAILWSGAITNTGLIEIGAGTLATDAGVQLNGGTLINAGTISGGGEGYAVQLESFTGRSAPTLVVEPNAVFIGNVTGTYGDSIVLELAGTGGTLAGLGAQFTGFDTIAFAPGASWTLEGNTTALANGEIITGFSAGDAIVLDDFTVSSESMTSAGLVLNGTTTLDVSGVRLAVNNAGGNATIAAEAPLGTITGTVTNTVTIDNVYYAATLTIAAGGMINAGISQGVNIAQTLSSFDVVNDGTIIAGFGTIYDNGAADGTIINHGAIIGAANDAVLQGVRMLNGVFANSGIISEMGRATNVGAATGVLLNGSATGSNSGTIIAASGDVGRAVILEGTSSFDNTGLIIGDTTLAVPAYFATQARGVLVSGQASLTNSGTIIANNYAGNANRGNTDAVEALNGGNVTNIGLIALGASTRTADAGVFLESGTLTNAGTISGGADGYAVYMSTFAGYGPDRLVVETGAVFIGRVGGSYGIGSELALEGAGGTLTGLGTQFTGFDTIAFAAGSSWTLAGNTTALANGETITGFSTGDAIVLDGITASAFSITSAGLVLNGTTTLGISGTTHLQVTGTDGNTTISTAPIGVIATTFSDGITLNNGYYAPTLSITTAGTILPGSSYGIADNGAAANFTLVNAGAIGGSTDGVHAAGGSGNLDLTNAAGAQIAGTNTGVYITNTGTSSLLNAGTIAGNLAVEVGPGAFSLSNAAAGYLQGSAYGLAFSGDTAFYAYNAGRIGGSGARTGAQVGNSSGAVFINAATGTISASHYGIHLISNHAATLVNAGSITSGKTGVLDFGTMSLTNAATGHISATNYAVDITGTAAAYINNAGSIGGGSYGIDGATSGALTLQNSGIISGNVGINANGALTLQNSGTISGTAYAVFTSNQLDLIIDPSAVFYGAVQGGASDSNRIDLAAGTTAGTFALTSSFINFSTVAFDAGSQWTLEGTSSEIADSLSITGFTVGDTIALTDVPYIAGEDSITVGTTGIVTIDAAGTIYHLDIASAYVGEDNFSITGDLSFTETVNCFAPGTRLLTPRGEVAIEALAVGDELIIANGTAQPIRWIGRSTVSPRFAGALRAAPIRILAGALGEGIPSRDLLVSPDHAMYVDGILASAAALVNGTSIVCETDLPEQLNYFHVELPAHELIFAEGALSESFVDNVNRMSFDNWNEHTTPDTPIAEMELPRAKAARQLPQAIRKALAARAASFKQCDAA